MRAGCAVLLVGVAALAAACGETTACRDDTVEVSLAFSGATSAADGLRVQVTVGAGGFDESVDRVPGASTGSLGLGFAPGAVTGKTVAVDVLALKSDAVIGEGRGSVAVDGRCGALSITIEPITAADMTSADLSVPVDDLAAPVDLASADLTPPPDMAVQLPAARGVWTFDEAAGTVAADSSGQGNNGTITGAAHIAGQVGGALAFNGTTNYVDVGNPTALQITGAMTVAAWVYINTVASAGRIIAKEGGPGNRSWSLNVETSGIARLIIAVDASTTVSADSVAAVPTGQWIHVAATYEPSVAVRFYLNGTLNNSNTTGVPAAQFDNGSSVNIGRRPDNGNYFDGRIDDVRVYNVILTAQQLSGLAH